ncbi:MAG: cytochrome c biogenesis protein CcsA [Kiritimatiellaeota bacterium]|nr:cytochrome c biogenesis protein CcsA [Kiritimatiellota bacterium]
MTVELLLDIVAGGLYAVAAVLAVAHMRKPGKHRERAIMVLATVCSICLLAALVLHGFRISRFPVFGRFEASAWYALAITGAYLYVGFRHEILRTVSAVLFPYVTIIVFLGATAVTANPNPNLQAASPLLALHVIAAFTGYGLFTLESVLAVAYLVQDRSLRRKRFGPLVKRLPSLETLDQVMFELIGPAFGLFTLSIGIGIILAHLNKWGVRWVTDPKVVMTGATWVVYAILFYLQRTAGHHGRRIAYVTVLGFACVLLAFMSVHFVAHGVHNFGFQIPSSGSR